MTVHRGYSVHLCRLKGLLYMIVDERIVTFINSLDTKNSELLETIEKEARRDDVPIIRREMQSFLRVLLMLKQPANILEVGTAVGFSALLMSESVPAGCRITTIENYEKRIPVARENFRRAGKECGKRTVYPFPSGDPPAAPAGRLPGIRQCDAGRRCDRIPVRRGAAQPDDPCKDAGISV